jgi:ERCC4-related helicase
MVCLPTGLGKTFIAANVMLNFYRWFPLGKIFFLAPTKPLVTQQKDAIECLNSIDSGHIIEITGSVNQKKRQTYYYEKRMFFMTPQTLENDLEKGLVLPEDVCLVIFGILTI